MIQNPTSSSVRESEYSSPTRNEPPNVKPLMFFGEDLALRYKGSSILGDDDSDDDRDTFKTFHSILDYQEQFKKIGKFISFEF